MSTQSSASTRTVAAAPAVTAAPAVLLQRTCACGQHTVGGEACEDCKKKKGALQRHGASAAEPRVAPSSVHEVLRSPGQPMDSSTRAVMETRFGRNFSSVRIHADERAAESARAVNALAYTVGRHIAFAHGQYQNTSRAGRGLLQHELVHTIQQSHVSEERIAAVEGTLEIGKPNDPLEHEAKAQFAVREPANRDPISRGEHLVLQRQTANSPESAVGAASGASGEYDGCHVPKAIANARAQATQRVEHAIELLEERNIQSAAPLLNAHFHLDLTRRDSGDDLRLIRNQFARMSEALTSGVRIFCRSAPRVGLGGSKPSMPVDEACAKDRANSTSCAAGNATATVTLCQTAIETTEALLVKTIIHEFAHVACNGNPPLVSGGKEGGEIYYDGDRLPGDQQNALNQADSYAWFALKADAVKIEPVPEAGPTKAKSGGSRLGWLALLAVAAALGIGGIWVHGLLAGAGLAALIGAVGLLGGFDSKPAPTAIRVVKNHQVPIDEGAVARGWRSGFGGVSEIEVSNGDINYDGSEIKEHFVRGHCENANMSGQGGTGGSTFAVGRAVSNNEQGLDISLPAKRNTFYDQHLFGSKDNVLPPGANDQFSVCAQQYTFDDKVIAGKSFLRRYDVRRATVGGQDVASFSLSTTEEEQGKEPGGNSPNPAQPKHEETNASAAK